MQAIKDRIDRVIDNLTENANKDKPDLYEVIRETEKLANIVWELASDIEQMKK